MSLDVYLKYEFMQVIDNTPAIYIREAGEVKRLTREEWDSRFPGVEPVTVAQNDDYVYEANITHNLAPMAREAGIYEYLWYPEDKGVTTAAQLIEPLETGLALLKSDRTRLERLNPANGWGDYEGLVRFTSNYLDACKEYPAAQVSASR